VELTAENYSQYEKDIDSLWNKFSKLFEDKIICKKIQSISGGAFWNIRQKTTPFIW
jgi:hypothetical protein